MSQPEELVVKPITPEEVSAQKMLKMPPAVIEAFNELISENYRNGRATIKLDDAYDRVGSMGVNVNDAERFGWMDVEPIYRDAGWNVTFEKSGFNEPGPSFYVFRKPS